MGLRRAMINGFEGEKLQMLSLKRKGKINGKSSMVIITMIP